jgi:branched-chain amino acid transport system permease protein
MKRVGPMKQWMWWIVGAAVAVFAAVLPLLNLEIPGVLPGATYLPGTLQLLAVAMLFASLALSYHLLFGTAGLLSFGHALYFGLGAYGVGLLLKNTTMPLLAAIGLTLAAVVVVAYLVGALSLRVTGISFAMVTLAFAQAGNVLVRRNPQLTGGDEGLQLQTDNVPQFLLGVFNTRNLYWVALGVLVIVFVIVTAFEHSRAGHVVTAIRENELRVRVLGLRPFGVKLVAFVLASVLAAVVGIVHLLLQSGVTPGATSSDFTLTLLVIVVLGGVGSRWGAVVGGIVYTLLDQRLTALASSDAINGLPPVLRIPLSEPLFILGTLFILVVIFLPGGIAGAVDRIGGRSRRTSASAPDVAERDRLEDAE